MHRNFADGCLNQPGPLPGSRTGDDSYMDEESINDDSYMPVNLLGHFQDEEGMDGSTGSGLMSLS